MVTLEEIDKPGYLKFGVAFNSPQSLKSLQNNPIGIFILWEVSCRENDLVVLNPERNVKEIVGMI